MKYDTQLVDLKSQLTTAKNILIALPMSITVDKLASALALMLSLKQNGKAVSVVSSDTVRVSHTKLFGVGEVQNQIQQNSSAGDFVVTLEGVVDTNTNSVPSLEKLDWYPEGANLNLVFHTLPGQKFEPINIKSQFQGGVPVLDLIFVIGASNLSELGELYSSNQDKFASAKIINIDNNPSNLKFGTINVVDVASGGISEMMPEIILGLSLPFDSDIASNVLTGIYDRTQNLTVNVSPVSFLAVSQAMVAGGLLPTSGVSPSMEQASAAPQIPSQNILQSPLPQQTFQPNAETTPPSLQPDATRFDLKQVFQIPENPPTNQSTEEVPQGEFAQSAAKEADVSPAPDWLTPKIYKGGSLG